MTTLDLSPGAMAWLDRQQVRIIGPAGLNSVMIENDSGIQIVEITTLSTQPSGAINANPTLDLAQIPQADWDLARRREEVIKPLMEFPRRTTVVVEEAAHRLGCSMTLVYRLLSRYEADPRTTTLLPQKRGKPKGRAMVSESIEQIMATTIEEFYLNRQRFKGKDVAVEVRRRCLNAGFKPVGIMTVYRRLKALPPKTVLKTRHGTKAAETKFLPSIGHFPATSWPLQVIQIDHTKVDVFVVDQVHRRPIGRPWLTIAIDVHTRMVVGFLLSLDPPSATSVALCLAHAIMAKEDWLTKRKLEISWPVWGKPDTIYVDNGKEFHSEALSRGCSQYGITLDYRPVRTPRYGGHIERLIGTMMGKVHLLPGTTFSNIADKGDYDSEKHACMTLPELESWLALGIDVYHQTIHSALGVPPLAAWKRGILGDDGELGRGLPARISDPERFLIDFLPFERRAVTKEGVLLNHIHYWSDAIRPLLNDGARYIVRYDPRDLSRVWLLSKSGVYCDLPYKSRHRLPISLWEHSAVLSELRTEGRRHIDEASIFDRVERMRAIVDDAAATTKSARRQAERRRANTADRAQPLASDTPKPDVTSRRVPKPFDVEEW